MDFLRRVEEYLTHTCHVSHGSHIVVAVSGGADSIALLDIFLQLVPSRCYQLHAAHLNHGLRGDEADRDEAAVRTFCEARGVPLTVQSIPTGVLQEAQGSIEANARQARRRFLLDVARAEQADFIALAHHADDQVETVCMALLRGAGPRGMRGMRPRRGPWIRPLLNVSRSDLRAYCRQRALSFVHDSSNDQLTVTRNRVRHHLLPLIRAEYSPQIDRLLLQTAEILAEEDDYLERDAASVLRQHAAYLGDRIILARTVFASLPVTLQRRVLRLLFRVLAGSGHDLSFQVVEDARQLLGSGQGSRRLHLPEGWYVEVQYDDMAVGRGVETDPKDWRRREHLLPVPGEVDLGTAMGRLSVRLLDASQSRFVRQALTAERSPTLLVGHAFIDYNKVNLPLWVRFWRPGDRIWPLGLEGSKKLQDVFVDQKVPRINRQRIPLLMSDSSIVWVVGLCLSEEFRVDQDTRWILHVRYHA